MAFARAYAAALGIPVVGVNHIEAHLHAAWLEDPDVEMPLAVLIVVLGLFPSLVLDLLRAPAQAFVAAAGVAVGG